MKKIIAYIVRHGEIDNPRKIAYGSNIEMSLSDKGRMQIQNLGLRILESGIIPSIIYSSILERGLESASILSKTLGVLNIERDPNLKDSYMPALAGKPISIFDELYGKGQDEYGPEFVKQGNESREEIINRMFGVYEKAILSGKDCVALVSHGDPIRFLLYKLENPDSTVIPGMNVLSKTDYLPKGHAWKLSLDEQGNFLSKELISPNY